MDSSFYKTGKPVTSGQLLGHVTKLNERAQEIEATVEERKEDLKAKKANAKKIRQHADALLRQHARKGHIYEKKDGEFTVEAPTVKKKPPPVKAGSAKLQKSGEKKGLFGPFKLKKDAEKAQTGPLADTDHARTPPVKHDDDGGWWLHPMSEKSAAKSSAKGK